MFIYLFSSEQEIVCIGKRSSTKSGRETRYFLTILYFRHSDTRQLNSETRPTQAIEIFGNISMPFGTLAICWHSGKILRRSS